MSEKKTIEQRLDALEELTTAQAAEIEAQGERLKTLEAQTSKGGGVTGPHAATRPAVLPVAHPLHPAKAGTSAYEELKKKLMATKPHEKEYPEAQRQLREASIITW